MGHLNGRISLADLRRKQRLHAAMMALGMVVIAVAAILIARHVHLLELEHSLPVPKLLHLTCMEHENSFNAVTFASEPGKTYEVLRKRTGAKGDITHGDDGFLPLETVTASAEKTVYRDFHALLGMPYAYTVREVAVTTLGRELRGDFDRDGIATLAEPETRVNMTNLNTTLKWDGVPDATAYRVLRSDFTTGEMSVADEVDAEGMTKFTYTDTYAESFTDPLSSSLLYKYYYVDPSSNPMVYEVVAVREDSAKTVTGYATDRIPMRLSPPAVLSVEAVGGKARVTFQTVPNATGYYICRGKMTKDGVSWQTAETLPARSVRIMNALIDEEDGYPYYTVTAFNDTIPEGPLLSGHDEGMHTDRRSNQETKILFIGDSLVYGTPYTYQLGSGYSVSDRVAQLLACKTANVSAGGATMAETSTEDPCILTTQTIPLSKGEHKKVSGSISDYDVVVLEGGANDYRYSVKLGSPDSGSSKTYYGALNQTFQLLREAGEKRVKKGKAPLNVVVVDLFYSARNTKEGNVPASRFETPNEKGLTYTDYQAALKDAYKRWSAVTDALEFHFFDPEEQGVLDAETCPYRTVDNLHMTAPAYEIFGNKLSAFLLKDVLK